MSRNRSEKRPWLGALFAFLYPGLGHVYLREWLRAAMWFGFALTTAVLFIPQSAIATAQAGGPEAYLAAANELPLEAILPVLAVQLFNIIDAYWIGLQRAGEPEGATCPACGKPLDEDLEFCHWCTTDLEEAAPEGDDGLIFR